jgi:hypothetical protein
LRSDGVAQPIQRLEGVEHEHHGLGRAGAQRGQQHVNLRHQDRDQHQIPVRCRIKFATDVNGRTLAIDGDDRPSLAQLLKSGATRDDRHIVTGLGQLKSERATDTARPDYRDLHLPINTSTAKMPGLSDRCAHSPNVTVSR